MIEPRHADRFEPLTGKVATAWQGFLNWDTVFFASHIGLRLAEVREDYGRIELDIEPHHLQPAGIVHGGVLATMIDTVVVPAVGSTLSREHRFSTISMTVEYQAAAHRDATTLMAEGWVTRRGRSVVFCRAEVVDDAGTLVTAGSCVYKVSAPRS